jgi:hypothetical protein
VKGEDIFSIHSNFVMADDLRSEIKHFEIAKTMLDADLKFSREAYASKDSLLSGVVFALVE